jgi:hypothetical protein
MTLLTCVSPYVEIQNFVTHSAVKVQTMQKPVYSPSPQVHVALPMQHWLFVSNAVCWAHFLDSLSQFSALCIAAVFISILLSSRDKEAV